MKWKKFKKERISLNYTVMLLPHSQKKPIHFKTPVWTFGLFFLGILVLSGTCLFFAGSRHQLKEVQQEKDHLEVEKEQLELEWLELAAQKQLSDQENENLKQAREQQEQELRQLEERTRDTIRELEELVERENQIREQLGLEELVSEGESSSDSEAESQVQTAGTDTVGIVPSFSHTDRTMSFLAIQSELSYLQNSLLEVSGQYDGYINTIEEIKAAEAAEIARKENLRKNLVASALQFVGNAYVYGGNDPYTGVDCSGFSRYILGHCAGIYLPRTAASQSTQGMPVSADEARPGDLVFYSSGGHVNHVAIYIGDGRVVHASNERTGITTSNMYYRTPCKIVNVLGD